MFLVTILLGFFLAKNLDIFLSDKFLLLISVPVISFQTFLQQKSLQLYPGSCRLSGDSHSIAFQCYHHSSNSSFSLFQSLVFTLINVQFPFKAINFSLTVLRCHSFSLHFHNQQHLFSQLLTFIFTIISIFLQLSAFISFKVSLLTITLIFCLSFLNHT